MIRNFILDESGQDLVEYSLLLVLIAAAALAVLTLMGQSVTTIFGRINNTLSSAAAPASGS